jgi:CheY-like chemotaxis protein
MPTALIVDDEPEANKLLALLVQLRGYETRSAFTGAEALELAASARPDVVLLDLMLPDLTGLDVCRALRARPETSLVPVVVVTARLAERSRAESYQAGATEFVPKPFTPDQIFGALGEAASWRRQLEEHGGSGEFRCPGCERLSVERRLAGLRCLLTGRTPLRDGDVRGISEAVQALCASACAWGEHRGLDRVATIAYRLHDDRLTLTVRDEAGWFEGGHPPLSEGIRDQVLRRDLFDEIAPAPSGRELTLTRRYREGVAGADGG